MPSINAVHREFEPRGLAVLLINIRESRETVARIATERGYVVPILLDADGRVSAEYAVQGTPTTYLVDRQGDVVARAIGPRPWTGPEGRALFRALLDAPPPRR